MSRHWVMFGSRDAAAESTLPRNRWWSLRRLAPASLLVVLSLSVPVAAFAHGDEGAVPARESVLQAIAYVVNTPNNMDMIGDKLKDAQESQDKSGVDLAEVRQAEQAFGKGDMRRVRLLLEESIGARADLTGMDVRHVLQVAPGSSTISLATGEQAGTEIVTDELTGRGAWTTVDSTVLVLAVVIAAAGALLAWRFRPAHSVHALRQRAAQAGPSAPPAAGK